MVLEKRKVLIPKMLKARKQGKFAIIKYDKLIIEEPKKNVNEKSKRQLQSPESPKQSKTKQKGDIRNFTVTNYGQLGPKYRAHFAQ